MSAGRRIVPRPNLQAGSLEIAAGGPALAEARGKTTLRSVLLVLAKEGKVNLSRTGAQLKRAPGEVHSYLERLADSDLVGREGRRYYITDPIIALWIKFTILERTRVRRGQGRHPAIPGSAGGTDRLEKANILHPMLVSSSLAGSITSRG